MSRPRLGDLTGAFGDVGTFLPLAAGLVLVVGVDARGLFVGFGLATLLSGLAFRLPMPVQPQKAIAATAIAEAWHASWLSGASLGLGLAWLVLALTPLLGWLRRAVPGFVARGVQLGLAFLLAFQALRFMSASLPLGVLAIVLLLLTVRHRMIIIEGGIVLTLGLGFGPALRGILAAFPMPLVGALLLLVALELLSSAHGLYGWQGWIATGMAVAVVFENVGVAFGAGLVIAYLVRFAVRRGWLPRLTRKTPAEYLARIPRRIFGPARAA